MSIVTHRQAKPFAELFNRPEDFERVFSSIEHTIMSSFAIDARMNGVKPSITDDKIRQRWQICERWFRTMRGDLGWSLVRTLDTLPKALASELVGITFDPSKENPNSFGVSQIKDILGKV